LNIKEGKPMRILSLLLVLVLVSPLRASLNFSGAATDRVDVGTDASLDNLNTGTILVWAYATSIRSTDRFMNKGASGNINSFVLNGTSGALQHAKQGTSSCTKITSTTPFAANQWNFVAVAYQFGTTNGGIYHGTLTTTATLQALATNNTGATVGDDGASNYFIGGNSTANNFTGRIARIQHFNVLLTAAQITALQFNPRVNLAGCVLWIELGIDGVGTQPNLCGNSANNGTVTGATVGDHVPLGAWFARTYERLWERAFAHLGGNPLWL
jgi:hypothetical protein